MTPETVRVRIAVAVDPTGKWNAVGAPDVSDEDAAASAREFVEPGEAIFWVEADLPIPATVTVEGTVSQ